jgi:hypothetical protein
LPTLNTKLEFRRDDYDAIDEEYDGLSLKKFKKNN